MEVNAFKSLMNQHNPLSGRVMKTCKRLPRGHTWKEYYQLAKKTEKIDYKCDFKNNICRSNRAIYGSRIPYMNKKDLDGISRGCCKGCKDTIGFLYTIPEDKLTIISKLFNKNTGFWRKGKGCVLPRQYRSVICLTYICQTASMKMKKSDLKFINKLRKDFYDLFTTL